MSEVAGFTISRFGDGEPAVVLVPGARYTAAHPLFATLTELLREEGIAWVSISWTGEVAGNALAVWRPIVDAAVGEALELAASNAVVVAKSVGTIAVESSRMIDRRGVWWTPTVSPAADVSGFGQAVRGPLSKRSVPDLVIGGSADPLWDRAGIAAQHQVLEFAGANHSLEVPDDQAASAHVRTSATHATLGYLLTALDRTSRLGFAGRESLGEE